VIDTRSRWDETNACLAYAHAVIAHERIDRIAVAD